MRRRPQSRRPPGQRHRPRYGSFLATGALVGLVVTVALVLGPGAEVDRRAQLFFYLGVLLAGSGALLGGLVAVVIESRRGSTAPDDGGPTTAP